MFSKIWFCRWFRTILQRRISLYRLWKATFVRLLFLEKPIFPPSHKVVQLEWDIFAMLWVPLIRNFYKTFEVSQYVGKALTLKYRYIEIVASRVKCCFSHFCSFNHYLFSLERCKKSFNAFFFIRRQPSDLFDLQRVYHLKNFVYRVHITKT